MRYIKVQTQFRWFHQYKKAPEKVKFLRTLHRHIFKVCVKIEVDHSDRNLEFFIVQDLLDSIILEYKRKSNHMESCEMIAEYILDYLETQYKTLRIEVEVSEDGENAGGINNYERFSTCIDSIE